MEGSRRTCCGEQDGEPRGNRGGVMKGKREDEGGRQGVRGPEENTSSRMTCILSKTGQRGMGDNPERTFERAKKKHR